MGDIRDTSIADKPSGDPAAPPIAEGGESLEATRAELESPLTPPPNDARVAELEAENAELRKEVDRLARSRDRAKASKGATTREARTGHKPRKFGKPPSASAKIRATEKDSDRKALDQAVTGDNDLEVAFVDENGNEIPELDPVDLHSSDFRDRGGAWRLAEPVMVKGKGEGTVTIAAFVLLKGGDVIAWQELPEPVTLPERTERRFDLDF